VIEAPASSVQSMSIDRVSRCLQAEACISGAELLDIALKELQQLSR